MSVSEDMSTAEWADTLPHSLRGDLEALEAAYFRHVDAGDVGSTVESAPTTVFREHVALALRRPTNESVWRVHDPADGSQIGAAVQIVTDDMPLLVKSVTTTLARLGASLSELIHPIFDVSRNGDGALQHVLPHEVDASGRALDLRESWMHLQLHPSTDSATLQRVAAAIPELLAEVRHVVDDTSVMRTRQREVAAQLDAAAAAGRSPYSAERLTDCSDLLRWLSEAHFTMLGYVRFTPGGPDVIAEDRLGVLRSTEGAGHVEIPAPIATDDGVLVLTEGSEPARVYRSVHPYLVGVAALDDAGEVVGRHLFVGVFTVTAMHESVLDIPVIERRVRAVIERAGFDLDSFSGQAMLEVIQTFPRSELFSATQTSSTRRPPPMLDVNLRRDVRLFLREDTLRPVRVLPGVPAARPLQHPGSPPHPGHPGARTAWRLNRVRRPCHRIRPREPALHGPSRRRRRRDSRRHLGGQPAAHLRN